VDLSDDATETPDDEQARLIKLAARQQWGHDPAGGLAAGDAELGTPESFARVERYRYQEQPWMHSAFRFERFTGRQVLEVGVGLGTDHLQFGRAGAAMTGIDLTPRCVKLTGRRVEQEGLASSLHVMDAEQLTFEDASFDVVYSFGVLHHTAVPERAFREIRRVLRPGGVFIGGLYNRRSAFVALMQYQRLVTPIYRHMSFEERLSLVEHSTNESATPAHVRAFTASELRRLLGRAGFQHVKIRTRHCGLNFRRFPRWLDEAVSRTAGWYLIHEAS
jgi:ubiquinone/menaquinone biosynthesis C-methylase UbiE